MHVAPGGQRDHFQYLLGAFDQVAMTATHAQQAQPFVPFTVDEATYKNLQSYLGEQPAKFATPLLNWLNNAEAKAISDKAAAEKVFETQKPAEPKKE